MSEAGTPETRSGAVAVENINRKYWRGRGVVETYAGRSGWLDAGECAVLVRVADDVRGRPILDIGVGGGRTVPLLRLLTADYTGVDYSREMVDACKSRFRDCDLRWGDARDLSAFPEGRYALTYFSYNGIDSVPHHERLRILSEIRRVVAPDGFLVFSSINYGGPIHRDRPWKLRPQFPVGPMGYANHVLRRVRSLPTNYRNYRTLKSFSCDAGTYAVVPGTRDYSVLVHLTTMQAALAELAVAGFGAVEVYSRDDGRRVDGGDTSTQSWLYYVAHGDAGRRAS